MFHKCDYSIQALTNEPLIITIKDNVFFGFIFDQIEQINLLTIVLLPHYTSLIKVQFRFSRTIENF
ncbi:hypothetical protein DERP_001849 [Dermatophagoides pteronyssinus]|uniref:Uncharacterized protein n=1 Tax=Dermatophagoides pteronyssinus TaxID=6956 RepID=A0ABQ8JC45_DERPT|nr:hypothetical protein DERP_001849 [Dermatophagoides pteronyssinus]